MWQSMMTADHTFLLHTTSFSTLKIHNYSHWVFTCIFKQQKQPACTPTLTTPVHKSFLRIPHWRSFNVGAVVPPGFQKLKLTVFLKTSVCIRRWYHWDSSRAQPGPIRSFSNIRAKPMALTRRHKTQFLKKRYLLWSFCISLYSFQHLSQGEYRKQLKRAVKTFRYTCCNLFKIQSSALKLVRLFFLGAHYVNFSQNTLSEICDTPLNVFYRHKAPEPSCTSV